MDFDPIVTQRLDLVPLTAEVMQAFSAARKSKPSQIGSLLIHPDADVPPALLAMRMEQLQEDPELLPWLLRVMIYRTG